MLSAASRPTLAKNARMGHPRSDMGKERKTVDKAGPPVQTPKNLWAALIARYNPGALKLTPKNGQDYGNPRFNMFNLMWLSLPQSKDNPTVTATATNCVIDSNGMRNCDTQ